MHLLYMICAPKQDLSRADPLLKGTKTTTLLVGLYFYITFTISFNGITKNVDCKSEGNILSVLEDAVQTGVNSKEYFAIASDRSDDRFLDLKFNQYVGFIQPSDYLVKKAAAFE